MKAIIIVFFMLWQYGSAIAVPTPEMEFLGLTDHVDWAIYKPWSFEEGLMR